MFLMLMLVKIRGIFSHILDCNKFATGGVEPTSTEVAEV